MKVLAGVLARPATLLMVGLVALAGCGDKPAPTEQKESVPPPPGAAALTGTETVEVEVTGQGVSREAAIDDALALAVAQVNGKTVGDGGNVRGAIKDFKVLKEEEVLRKIAARKDEMRVDQQYSESAKVNASGAGAESYAFGGASGSASASAAYSAEGSAESKGSVEITTGSSGKERVWQVSVRATVLKFSGGADAGKPRIVVVPPKTSQGTYEIGDSVEPAAQVAARVQRMLSEQIQASNRYLVIDRSFDSEINEELYNVGGESANPADLVKWGQRLTADIAVIPVIEYFEYRKNVRPLKLSGRELVSYSGGFRGRVAVVNVATGQLMLNESYALEFPTTEPRMFGPGVNSQGVADQAVVGLAEKFVGSLLRRTFPVYVLSLDGNSAVLSQGGSTLKAGATYQVMRMGETMTDPQTGQSLGRVEQPFGTIKVTRVEASMSYGELNPPRPIPAAEFKQGLLEIREQVEVAAAAAAASGTAASDATPPAGPAPAAARPASGRSGTPAAAPKDDFLLDPE